MTHRRTTLFMSLGGVALMLASTLAQARPLLVYNATPSAPIGFYRVSAARGLRVGDLVIFRAPPRFAALLAERGYLPLGVPLLKGIAAVAGDRVCERDGHVVIAGTPVAKALPVDGKGRPMPIWQGCRTLAAGEFFAMLVRNPASLDSRYFGPVATSLIIGKAVPWWTF
jgi:conjugative transfer signal peptidase TraF